MRSLTIKFIPTEPGYEDIEVESDDFEADEILQAIEHALLQLRLHGGNKPWLRRIK